MASAGDTEELNPEPADDTEELSPVPAGSDVFFENICQPCNTDGKILEAEGMCADCDEYLCKRCFEFHTLPSVTRNHVLIGKGEMNKDGATNRKDQCTQKCPQHTDEIIKYYCPTHSFLGCSACMIMNHTPCGQAVYIPDVAKDVLSSEKYREYVDRKTAIETKSQDIADESKQRLDHVKCQKRNAVEKIKCFKSQIIELFEKKEKDVIEECEKIEREELRKQESIHAKSKEVAQDLKVITSDVEKFERKTQYCNMYVELLKVKDGFDKCDNMLRDIDHRDDKQNTIWFSSNYSFVDDVLKNGIGKVINEIKLVTHDTDIDVKTQSDSEKCWITGSVLLPCNKLVIADRNNKKLKLVDQYHNKVVDELSMPKYPWSVSMTGPTEVAITLNSSKKIAFVKVDSKLLKSREIKVDQKCYGLACCDNKLIVTLTESPKVVVMDMQGVVLQTIVSNEIKKLLDEPYYVFARSLNEPIYVSNARGRKVMSVKSDGTVISTYTGSDLGLPLGLASDGLGMIYICDWDKHGIHQVTEDLKKRRILLGPNDVSKPYTISFCDTRDRFYVGMRDSDTMKVFRVA